MNLFAEEIEQTAIERIQKFSKIAKAMGNLTSITLLKAISL